MKKIIYVTLMILFFVFLAYGSYVAVIVYLDHQPRLYDPTKPGSGPID